MHRLRRAFDADGVDADQSDRSEQRHAGAVELQERQPAQDHAEIDDAEDDNDRCRHRRLADHRGLRENERTQARAVDERRRHCSHRAALCRAALVGTLSMFHDHFAQLPAARIGHGRMPIEHDLDVGE